MKVQARNATGIVALARSSSATCESAKPSSDASITDQPGVALTTGPFHEKRKAVVNRRALVKQAAGESEGQPNSTPLTCSYAAHFRPHRLPSPRVPSLFLWASRFCSNSLCLSKTLARRVSDHASRCNAGVHCD